QNLHWKKNRIGIRELCKNSTCFSRTMNRKPPYDKSTWNLSNRRLFEVVATGQRLSELNMLDGQMESVIEPNGGRPCDGRRDPGLRNTSRPRPTIHYGYTATQQMKAFTTPVCSARDERCLRRRGVARVTFAVREDRQMNPGLFLKSSNRDDSNTSIYSVNMALKMAELRLFQVLSVEEGCISENGSILRLARIRRVPSLPGWRRLSGCAKGLQEGGASAPQDAPPS
ncbi:unnamed protein product, partial [Nesidiocoris tenuis]